ncbi:MAG: RIP metalloprotease RseP [Nitrospinae bacterium]|nr:RIP metalloprotease RseP [Nitrospinota bacterium]
METLFVLDFITFDLLFAWGYKIGIVIAALGPLIFIHELGHFLIAKMLGIGVEKFSLGFGPKIIGKRVGETEYLISLFLLGGYVKLVGEDPSEECEDKERSFSEAPIWKRFSIVSAGPLFNIFTAILIFAIVFMVGFPTMSTRVGEVKEGSPAMIVGIKKGDKIVRVNGKRVNEWETLAGIIRNNPGKEMRFEIEKESGEIFQTIIAPIPEKSRNIFGEEIDVGLIGIIAEGEIIKERYNPVIAFLKGFEVTWRLIKFTVLGVVKMIEGKVSSDNIAGPLGIAKIAVDVANIGLLSFIQFVSTVSIILGIMNLLPIPILDGGHIIFFLIEAIFRRPVSIKRRDFAFKIGLFLLIALMLFATYIDIIRLLK